jgi:hypothetical protein
MPGYTSSKEENIVAQQAAAIEFIIFYKALGGGCRRLLNEWR